MTHHRRAQLLLTIFLLCGYSLAAQELRLGFGVSGGASWEIERLPLTVTSDPGSGVTGGPGIGLVGVVAYRMGSFDLGVRPELLAQGGQLYYQTGTGDDGGERVTNDLYPLAVLLPARVGYCFGQQKWRPCLGLASGVLIDLTDGPADAPRAERILPYLEVSVGAEVQLPNFSLRPELTVRNGTGEMFRQGAQPPGPALGGQRWGYVAFGLVILY